MFLLVVQNKVPPNGSRIICAEHLNTNAVEPIPAVKIGLI
jgi:hypothetical protein